MTVSVVTGATGGIGRWIALGLAQAGHAVVMVGRDPQRGRDAQAWILSRAPGARLDLRIGDLSLLAATRVLAESLVADYPAINVLVNNAGMFRTSRAETAEGHECVIALNHLSPFVFTRALLPALERASPGARIVNVGSSTADRARIDVADLEGRRRWGMVRAYGQSKLALTLATFGWADRLRETGVVANVVHPGLVATRIVRASGVIGLAWRVMAPFALTEEQGADTPLHVALSPTFAIVTGAYVKRRTIVPPNPLARDARLVARLWQATVALVDAAPMPPRGPQRR